MPEDQPTSTLDISRPIVVKYCEIQLVTPSAKASDELVALAATDNEGMIKILCITTTDDKYFEVALHVDGDFDSYDQEDHI